MRASRFHRDELLIVSPRLWLYSSSTRSPTQVRAMQRSGSRRVRLALIGLVSLVGGSAFAAMIASLVVHRVLPGPRCRVNFVARVLQPRRQIATPSTDCGAAPPNAWLAPSAAPRALRSARPSCSNHTLYGAADGLCEFGRRHVFASGQIPIDPATGDMVAGDARAQTTRVLENVRAVLEAGGSSFERVVKSTVFLLDLADFAGMNEVYATYFPHTPPARSTIQVASLPRDARVEIEIVALLDPEPAG